MSPAGIKWPQTASNGVDLATLWAYEHQDWIRNNTSGLALIQIRAYPSQDSVQAYFDLINDRKQSWLDRFISRAATSFHGLTSPLEGGLNAREWSMRFRNATQVRALDDLFNGPDRPEFFRTFVFENFAEFAMNWFLSDRDIDRMRNSISSEPGEDPSEGLSGLPGRGEQTPAAGDPPGVASLGQEVVKRQNLRVKQDLIRWWQGGECAGESRDDQEKVLL